jgi:hypothetical protein
MGSSHFEWRWRLEFNHLNIENKLSFLRAAHSIAVRAVFFSCHYFFSSSLIDPIALAAALYTSTLDERLLFSRRLSGSFLSLFLSVAFIIIASYQYPLNPSTNNKTKQHHHAARRSRPSNGSE